MVEKAFLDYLAAERSEVEFKGTAVGVAALQLYDSVKAHGYDPLMHSAALKSMRDDISFVASEVGIPAALDSFIQALPFWEASGAIRVGRRAVYSSLVIYGQALGDDGQWGLAQKIHAIVGMDAELDGETWISAEARLLGGRASRMNADWQASRIAYSRAYELAIAAGDIALALRARIGEANNHWSRGDFPAAKKLLILTARRARESCPEILPRVRLAMAGVANAAGEYERAIYLAFGLLGTLSDNDDMRYKTLVDLASFLTDYGLPDVAGSALQIIERQAPEPQIRVHARLNLFFLAARNWNEEVFDQLRSALAKDALTPRQQVQYSLFSAQGFRRLRQLDAALDSVQHAVTLSRRFELYQFMFEAESELRAIEAERLQAVKVDVGMEALPNKAARRDKLPPGMHRVAESLSGMAAVRPNRSRAYLL